MRIRTMTTAGAVIAAGLLVGPAGATALADPTYPPVPPSGSPAPISGGGGGPAVAPSTGVSSVTTNSGLPRTGQDLALLALVGGAAFVGGAGVVVAMRRPRASGLAPEAPTDEPLAPS
jgi:LPXTG-motif cell wall-anchored protein